MGSAGLPSLQMQVSTCSDFLIWRYFTTGFPSSTMSVAPCHLLSFLLTLSLALGISQSFSQSFQKEEAGARSTCQVSLEVFAPSSSQCEHRHEHLKRSELFLPTHHRRFTFFSFIVLKCYNRKRHFPGVPNHAQWAPVPELRT